jgi:hypothetical protein
LENTVRNPWLTFLTSGLLLTPATAAPLLVERFETGSGNWEAHGCDGGPLSDGLHAADGLALRVDYTAEPGFHAAALQVQQSFKGARTVRFWVRTSHDAMLLAVLQEENDAAYATMLYSPAETGQVIELGLDRFTLWADSNDDNDRLDLDKLKLVAIADMSGELKGVFDGPGGRSLWLDDFEVVTEAPAHAYSQDGLLPLRLADEHSGLWSWLPMVGQLNLIPAQGLQWRYDGAPGLEAFHGLSAIGLLLGQLPADGATHLLLTIASERAATFAVVLQEAKGGERNESRYMHPLQLSGGTRISTLALPLDDFVMDPDQGDENSRLDLDQVHLLLLVDVETGQQKLAAPNQITIEAVELVGAQ